MRVYRALFAVKFKDYLQYRAAAVAGVVCQFFFGMVIVLAYVAFYRNADASPPMTLEQTVAYVWLGQALFALIPWLWDRDTALLIRNGNVAYEMVRPVDLYWLWYARAVAWKSAAPLMRCLPILVFAAVFFRLRPPVSVGAAVAFCAALGLSLLLSAAIVTITNISRSWTISGEGVARLNMALVGVLSGIMVPLPFFPDWFQPVVKALPYRGVIDIPFRLYLGHIPLSAAPVHLAQQAAWTVVLVVLGRWLMARGRGKIVVQGG